MILAFLEHLKPNIFFASQPWLPACSTPSFSKSLDLSLGFLKIFHLEYCCAPWIYRIHHNSNLKLLEFTQRAALSLILRYLNQLPQQHQNQNMETIKECDNALKNKQIASFKNQNLAKQSAENFHIQQQRQILISTKLGQKQS